MGDQNPYRQGSEEWDGKGAQGEAASIPQSPAKELRFPAQTPLFHAQQAERYQRQELIRQYQEHFDCRLVVLRDVIFPDTIPIFEELVATADPNQNLHLILDTPGGDGETAVRLARSAQRRCAELTVIVPDQAKSAGTLVTMGAHHILMGPTSDLGPVDPQFPAPDGGGLYSAKDLIAAVENAEEAIAVNPESYTLHVSLLADVTALMVQEARSALERSGDLVREALRSHPGRDESDVERLAEAVQEQLISLPKDHGAVFDANDAADAGLPVIHTNSSNSQWRLVWQLWTKYFALDLRAAEGEYASQTAPMPRFS